MFNLSFRDNLYNIIEFKRSNSFFKKKYNFISNFFRFKIKKVRKMNRRKKSTLFKKKISFFRRKPKLIQKVYDYRKRLFSFIMLNRKLINLFLFKKLTSKKLTKLIYFKLNWPINKFKKILKSWIFFILFSTKLIFSMFDLLFVLKNNLIFLNKGIVKNYFLQTKKNDVITIIYSKYFFYYTLYKQKNIRKSVNKFKWKHAFRLKINYSKLVNFRFFSSKYFKSWIHFFYQIPKFLEVDYSILTIIIISDYNYAFENTWWTKFFSIYINSVYNWKHLS